jgi:hypothetical protein
VRNFSFVSSGNAAEDERIAQEFELHRERMDNNVCPNGCAVMKWIDAHNRECPKCGFAGFSTKPYDMKAAQA